MPQKSSWKIDHNFLMFSAQENGRQDLISVATEIIRRRVMTRETIKAYTYMHFPNSNFSLSEGRRKGGTNLAS